MRPITAITGLVLVCLMAFGLSGVYADDPPTQAGASGPAASEGSSGLTPLLEEFVRQHLESTPPQPAAAPPGSSSEAGPALASGEGEPIEPTPQTADDPVRFDASGNVQVYIHLEDTGEETLAQLRELGANIEVTNSDWKLVQAWVPAASLNDFAALAGVREITQPDYAVFWTGRVTSEGDAAHRANLARQFTGLTGAGVKIGVISDGASGWKSRAGTDLPRTVETKPGYPYWWRGYEGTALLEIIHDIAPGAQLAFAPSDTSANMVTAILWLANDAFGGEGADVIVDDVGFFLEPYFEDGAIAKAAADAIAGGTVYVSSAGNAARRHYEAEFVDGGDGYHDFDASSATDITLRISPRGGSSVFLQWNDQHWASGNDYDLFICRTGQQPTKFNLQNGVCTASAGRQNGHGRPVEVARVSGGGDRDVLVRKVSGSAKRLELFVYPGYIEEHNVEEGGVVGHPAVDGAIAVGSVRVEDGRYDVRRDYSDWGPARIYFPTEQTRNKPDVVAVDGVKTTGPGGYFNPFYGTSAAAPHVAGIAALAIEAQRLADPSMTRKRMADAVAQKLRDTAIDIGTQDANGYHKEFGYGRADAFSVADSLGRVAATFTVDSVGDGTDSDTTDGACADEDGNCTLRAAIQEVNARTGSSVIKFNISGNGTRTIQPATALPTVSKTVFIDGYSQSGAGPGTVLIELDGTNAGDDVNGLELSGADSYLRGLAVNRFDGHGIVLSGTGGQIVEGSRLGVNPAGDTDQGNGGAGVYVNTSSGGAVLRDNVISGNDSHGVSVAGRTPRGQKVSIYENKIGTNAAGTADLGNTGAGVYSTGNLVTSIANNVIAGNDSHGVSLSGTGSGAVPSSEIQENHIGSTEGGASLANGGSGVHVGNGARDVEVAGNTIANNAADGITVVSSGSRNVASWRNSIHSNGGLGIDLGDDGVTANDRGDGDSGPNGLQNFPELSTVALRQDAGAVQVSFDARARQTYAIELYASSSCDASGNGEGEQFIGWDRITADRTGYQTFDLNTFDSSLQGYQFPEDAQITAIATVMTGSGDDYRPTSSSEFSPCLAKVTLPQLSFSVSSAEVAEGAAAGTTYTVALTAAPTASVTVSMVSLDTGVATVSPASLTFTPPQLELCPERYGIRDFRQRCVGRAYDDFPHGHRRQLQSPHGGPAGDGKRRRPGLHRAEPHRHRDERRPPNDHLHRRAGRAAVFQRYHQPDLPHRLGFRKLASD